MFQIGENSPMLFVPKTPSIGIIDKNAAAQIPTAQFASALYLNL